jgi:2-hydroxychromene-2-carboxylate isomerase
MATPRLSFWHEYASTYSYLAAARIGALAHARGVAVDWRPFLLGPLFAQQQGMKDSPFNVEPVKGRYMWRDMERLCARYDLPFRRPAIFPQHTLLVARVATVAAREGWIARFSPLVYRANFAEGRTLSDAAVVADLIAEAGLAPDAVLATAQSEEVKSALRATGEEAERLGIFGAPSFTTADGELFWGHDRMEDALDWTVRIQR